MRYGQLVIGPAGSGKSTYCSALVNHCQATNPNRVIEVINLDPAAEYFNYEPLADVRELIHVDDAMSDESLHFGPNGALIFCMEYLCENLDWLQTKICDTTNEDTYILFDCPGQIELYTHLGCVRKLIKILQNWDFQLCVVYLCDAQFITSGAKFISGTMAALSVMVNLELPHVNLLSKIDLLAKSSQRKLSKYFEPDCKAILYDDQSFAGDENYTELTKSIGELIESYSLVQFLPLNLKNEDNLTNILLTIDNAIQYGEDLDVKTKDFEDIEEED